MDQAIEVDVLPREDHQAALAIIDQLGDCRTREQLNQLLITALIPLMNCSGAFYARLEGEQNTPHLLDDINQSALCRHSWRNFLEVATQTQLLDAPISGESSTRLATDAFCCTGQGCRHCCVAKCCHQNNRCCAIVALFDTPRPTVVLCFCRLKSQEQSYSSRDFELLQILRVSLLQTIKAVMFQEQCRNFQQMMDHMSGDTDPLAVFRDDGILVYKNQAFDRAVKHENTSRISKVLSQASDTDIRIKVQQPILTRMGRRLYAVSHAPVNEINKHNDLLYLLRFSRITDKNGKMSRKLGNAGLTSRELEIAALIRQGIPTRVISEQLNLSYHTVRNHIKHIYSKIDVSTRGEMLAWGG